MIQAQRTNEKHLSKVDNFFNKENSSAVSSDFNKPLHFNKSDC